MARVATLSDRDHKIVKTVDENSYTAFCFFWGEMPFRAIYSVRKELDETVGRFTVWALDKTTGIWGCFADAHDLGFDHAERFARQLENEPAMDRHLPSVLESVEDEILLDFLEEAHSHIMSLFQNADVAGFALKRDEWLEMFADQIPIAEQPENESGE